MCSWNSTAQRLLISWCCVWQDLVTFVRINSTNIFLRIYKKEKMLATQFFLLHRSCAAGNYHWNNRMVISVSCPNVKVAYRSRRLHKDTLGRGRLRVRFRAPSMSSHPGGTPQPISTHDKGDEEIGIWPGLSMSLGQPSKVHCIPRNLFFVETPWPVGYLSIRTRYGNNCMVISVPCPNAKAAYRSRRLHSQRDHFRGFWANFFVAELPPTNGCFSTQEFTVRCPKTTKVYHRPSLIVISRIRFFLVRLQVVWAQISTRICWWSINSVTQT